MSKLLLRLAMLLALGTGFAAYGAHAGDGEYRWNIVGYRTFIADYYSAPTLAKISELEHRVTTGLENSRLSWIYCGEILNSLDHGRRSKEELSKIFKNPNVTARALLDTIAEEKAARLKTVSMDSGSSSSSSEGDRYGGGSAAGGYIDDCP